MLNVTRPPTFTWLASLAVLGLCLINFLGMLTGAPWCAPIAGLLAATGAEDAAGGRWSRCLLLGDCAPGAFGDIGISDLMCVAVLVVCAVVVAAGARRIQHGADAGAEHDAGSRIVVWWSWLGAVGIGLTLAGAAGTALEAAGLWTRLVSSPNPSAEQGAPVWVPWLIAAALVAASSAALRRFAPDRSRRRAAGDAAVCLVLSLAVWATAILVHTSLSEPVQGRYYGLPGIVVGRSQNYEYGTYLGMIAPAAAGLCCLVLIVAATRPRRSPRTDPSRVDGQ
jgi:hypothetical protein